MILGSIQPSYLAWIPFIARMAVSNVFVYLDDVEYSKNSFHNRNRIRNKQGELLLTVPVLYKGNSKALICDIEIDYKQNWQEKHFKSIQMCYQKAPFYEELKDFLGEYYDKRWNTLADLNVAFIEHLVKYIGLNVPCYRSSALGIRQNQNYKLVELCRQLKADTFIVKAGTESYHPSEFFAQHAVKFAYFAFTARPYRQCDLKFIPNLSVLDFAMFEGKGSIAKILEMTNLKNSE